MYVWLPIPTSGRPSCTSVVSGPQYLLNKLAKNTYFRLIFFTILLQLFIVVDGILSSIQLFILTISYYPVTEFNLRYHAIGCCCDDQCLRHAE